MKTKPLRIGLIGAGANTQDRHIPGLRALPEVKICAVSNRTTASAQAVAAKWGIPVVRDDWRQVIDDPEIDAVVIGTWPNLHADVTAAALAAGKHVLTEARMAASLPEAERMLQASRARPDLVAQIVPAPGSLDFDSTIEEFLRLGRLGALREVCLTQTSGVYADSRQPMVPRLNEKLSGINTLSFGIYYETVRRWLGVDPAAMVADGAVFTRERADGGKMSAVRVPESFSLLGRYADGSRLIAHFSGVDRGAPRNEIRLHGASASLRLDWSTGQLWLADGEAPESLVEVSAAQRRGWRVEADFIASIRTGAPVRLTDFETGLAYMRVTDAARRAAAQFESTAWRLSDSSASSESSV